MSQPERKLGTWPIFVIAVSAMTPLTVVAGALPLGYGQVGEKGIPVAYMLVAAVLGVFAVGLAAMARHVPNSGAFYAYASIGLSRPLGVGTAFVALLAYNAMQIGLYGAFGVAAHHALAIFGIEISWIILALVGWALIGLLGQLDIDLNARILTVLVCAEVLIVLIFDAVMIGNPAGGTVSFETLNPALIASAGGVSLLVAAIAGMVGFEAPLVYAAEARDPRRTIARAIGFTLLVAAFLYGGTAWAMSVVAGPDQIVAVAADHLDDLFFFLPEPYLSSVIIDLGRIFFATSLFAAMLAFHHTVARYVLTVAREGVLPPALAVTRQGVPIAASLAQSALAVVALVIFAIGAWNPTTDLFFFGTVSGGLGVLILMTIASVAVVRFFRRHPSSEIRWRRAVAPWISTVFLWLVLLITVAFFGDLLGSDNPAKIWSPIVSFLLVLIIGIVWGKRLRTTRPEVYAVIGTGHPPLAQGEAAPPTVLDADPLPAASAPQAAGRPAQPGDKPAPDEATTGQPVDEAEPAGNRIAEALEKPGPGELRSGEAGDQSATAEPKDATAGPVGVTADPGGGTAGPEGRTADPGGGTAGPESQTAESAGGTPSVIADQPTGPAAGSGDVPAEGEAGVKPRPSPRPRTSRPRKAAAGGAAAGATAGGTAGGMSTGPVTERNEGPAAEPSTGEGPVAQEGTAAEPAGSGGSGGAGAGRRTPSPRKRASAGQGRKASESPVPGAVNGTPGAVNGTPGAVSRVSRARPAANETGQAGDGSPGGGGGRAGDGSPGEGGGQTGDGSPGNGGGQARSDSPDAGRSGTRGRTPRPRSPRAPEQPPVSDPESPDDAR
ncbi:MAG TPA: amino acid permease [Actinoplanes sp.]|nr:amino acid permease [Actinoplanes sp.]